MYLLEYRRNPRMFWITLIALVVVVIFLWPRAPKCVHPTAMWDDDAGQSVAVCK